LNQRAKTQQNLLAGKKVIKKIKDSRGRVKKGGDQYKKGKSFGAGGGASGRGTVKGVTKRLERKPPVS